MTELEKLRKHIKYFRRFALNIKTIVRSGVNHKKAVGNVRGEIALLEKQWPNWLDDDIEAMKDD